MNKLCPSCGTPFNLGPQDEGKQFACFKCSSALVVTRAGLQLADARPPVPALSAATVLPESLPLPPPSEAAVGRSARPTFPAALSKVADVPTWLFAIGTFLVIVFLFFPLINHAKVDRARAQIDAGKHKVDRLDRQAKQKDKDFSPADEELRRKAKENWARDKDNLEDEAKEVEFDTRRSDYFYIWGMMIGFLFLAAASLGYLNPAQPLIRRVVGAVVILAEVLLIFLRFITKANP